MGINMKHGFIRIAAAVPNLKVANIEYNSNSIQSLILRAEEMKAQFVVFPELSMTAYTCGDLFHQQTLLSSAETQLDNILKMTSETSVVAILGMPISLDNQLFNCGVAIQSGNILGVVPKSYIPGYSEYYEERWFASGMRALSKEVSLCGQLVPFGIDILFEGDKDKSVCFGIEVCEDLWAPIPPSSYQAISGATLLFNLSASNEVIGKYEYRKNLVALQSGKCIAGYVYTSAGINESSTDLVFGGHAIIAENGSILTESERFSNESQMIFSEIDIERLKNDRLKNTSYMELAHDKSYRRVKFNYTDYDFSSLNRSIDPHPFVPSNDSTRNERCREIFSIQTSGLGKRVTHTGLKHAVIGISGGLDSTLALLVTAKTFDTLGISRKNIFAVTMPGFGTTDRTYNNAIELMKSMGVTVEEIDIKESCLLHFKDIRHDANVHDTTYENVQARERTQILMDIANKVGGLVIGTCDLSEIALGWSTYNGDHMSMYSVNCGIPKTLVKFLVKWVADNMTDEKTQNVLNSVLNTPISPELLPPDAYGKITQKTEAVVGPYELHDFFLYHIVRYGAAPSKVLFLAERAFVNAYDRDEIKHWLDVFYRRFFSQQFKRSCMPDGPKVGTISLSPRGDWRMPSDADASLWLKELEGFTHQS